MRLDFVAHAAGSQIIINGTAGIKTNHAIRAERPGIYKRYAKRRKQVKKKNVRNVEIEDIAPDTSEAGSNAENVADLFSITLRNNKICKIKPQYLEIRIENKQLNMEINSGSLVSLISKIDKEKYFPELKLDET